MVKFCSFSCCAIILVSEFQLLVNLFLYLHYRKIKVWDLQAALDPRSPNGTLCLRTLVVRDFIRCITRPHKQVDSIKPHVHACALLHMGSIAACFQGGVCRMAYHIEATLRLYFLIFYPI